MRGGKFFASSHILCTFTKWLSHELDDSNVTDYETKQIPIAYHFDDLDKF